MHVAQEQIKTENCEGFVLSVCFARRKRSGINTVTFDTSSETRAAAAAATPTAFSFKIMEKNHYLLRRREDNSRVGNCNQMAVKFNYRG
jgi:hypothetical protein